MQKISRRDALKLLGSLSLPFIFHRELSAYFSKAEIKEMSAADFGRFTWGVACASYQCEGAWDADGKGISVWDTFANDTSNIKDHTNANTSCDFYHHYKKDIALLKSMNFGALRFSISWPRIFPKGTGEINVKGIDFYNRVIDACIENGIEPWVTLYHWDLPQALQNKGGWRNRDTVYAFCDYVKVCADAFGDRVKNWIVLNEPLSFSLFGYGIGIHAPGEIGLNNFFHAAHHAALAQSLGGKVLRECLPNANIGTAISCSPIEPQDPNSKSDIRAARRLDAIMNRMFVEPLLGKGYPYSDASILHRIDKYMQADDEKHLSFDYDFWGLQYYFRVVVNGNRAIPILQSTRVSPQKLGNEITEMNWEVHPEGLYKILKQFSQYPVKSLLVSETGAAFPDKVQGTAINDAQRVKFYKEHLYWLLKAKYEGVKVDGMFAWSFTDNFEWAEGYRPRFGLVYVDYDTQSRIIKDSGKWFTSFLENK
ncbi:MAG TPA: GH1 family beta-glucosidase [Bacteroidales bacterium]|nr:GH1 family beta-glucosidase [Bacteroidales bacterium]